MTNPKLTRRDFLKLSALTAAGATLASCAPAAQPGGAPAPGGNKSIGVVLWSTTGTSALQAMSVMTKAANVTGIKYEVLASGYNADAQLKDVENFVAKGVNGILVCNSSEEVVAKMADLCEPKKIYFAQMFRNLTKPEIHDRVFKSPYYVGNAHEDEQGTAGILGKTIADMGIKNVAITTGPHGDSTAENRYAGLKKALEANGVKILAEQWDVTTGETAATACQNFISSYPELELIATMYSVEAIKAAVTAIKNAGKEGQIKVAAQDTTGDAPYDLELLSSGKAIMAGGHILDPVFPYMLLANAINGTPLSDKPVEAIITQIVYTPERAKVYFEHMEKGNELLGYNEDEIKQMWKPANPAANGDLLVKMAAAWSVEDFMKRRKLEG